jgi:hypothetical protein
VIEERKLDTEVNLLDRPQSSLARRESGKGYGPFLRYATLLTSGTRFIMTTDDPANKPLPDPGLMALQWHLQRVLAMSGAAGWSDEDFGNVGDDGDDGEDGDEEDNEDDGDDGDDTGGMSSRDIKRWRREVPRPTLDHEQTVG